MPTYNTNADTRVSQVSASTPKGTEARLWIGEGSTGLIDRILVNFDVSSIPAYAVINSAILRFIQYDGADDWASPTISIAAQLITASWSESTATWNNQPATAGVDSPSTSLQSAYATPVDINVTSLLQTWVANPSSYFGFQVRYTGSSSSTRKEFRSKEYGSNFPTLIVDYTANTAPYWNGGATVTPSLTGVIASTTSSIGVSWTAAVDDQSNTIYYDIYRTYNYGNSTRAWNGITANSITDTNIGEVGAGDYFWYDVYCHDGLLAAATYLTSVTVTKNTLPVFPGGASCWTNQNAIFPSSTNTIVVSWTAAEDAQTKIYEVYRSTNGGAFSMLSGASTTNTYWSDATATGGAGTTYAYKIYVKDSLNEYATTQVTSSTITKNTLPTWNSTTVTVDGYSVATIIPENDASLTVAWTAGNVNNAGQTAYYDVYRSINGGGYQKIVTLTTSTSAVDAIGDGNQGYTYQYRIYIYDGLEYASTQVTSALITKNLMTAPTLNAIAAIAYSATTVTKDISWTAATDTKGSAMTYKITCNEVTMQNATQNVTSGYDMPVYVSGSYSTPYIIFNDLKTLLAGSSYNGSITIVLTATNAYGSTKTSSKIVSVDLRTTPVNLGVPSTNQATSAYQLPASTGLWYYIPNRKNISITWTAATDPLGTAITYDLQASYNSAAYVNVQTGLTSNSASVSLPEQSAATTCVFKVIARSAYGYTSNQVATSITLHYYRSPTIVISNFVRNETSVTIGATISYNTSITEVAVRTLSTLTYIGVSGSSQSYGSLTLTPSKTETVTSTSKYTFSYTVQDIGGAVIGTTASTVSIYVNAYAPMFSLLENGVAINAVIPDTFDGYYFRVGGKVLFTSDGSGLGGLYTDKQITSTLATGTAPFAITSTTQVTNLNASFIGGTALSGLVTISSGLSANLDTFYGSKMFGFYNTTVGAPAVTYGQGIAIVSEGGQYNGSTNWITQLAFSTKDEAYFRTKVNDAAWGGWRKFWNSGNDGSGSGLDADLLDGVHADTSANINTVVKRDANGYVFAKIFNQYFAADNNTATHYYYASDNYLRKKTLANVKTEIVTKAAVEATLKGNITTHTHQTILGLYNGGNQKPSDFTAGYTSMAMLNRTNLAGIWGYYADIIFPGNYAGGDVKGTTAIALDKYSANMYLVHQNFDATAWGTPQVVWNSGNLAHAQGSWTPYISFGGGTTGITYSAQYGYYTRIGNRVFISGIIILTSKGSSTGIAYITNFPYTVTSSNYGYSTISLRMEAFNGGNYAHIQALVVPGTNYFRFENFYNGTMYLLSQAEFTDGTVVAFDGSYVI